MFAPNATEENIDNAIALETIIDKLFFITFSHPGNCSYFLDFLIYIDLYTILDRLNYIFMYIILDRSYYQK